jgi:hypothetical protein
MGWFSNSNTSTTQQSFQQQAATESGFALGGGVVAGQGATINISTPDQAALAVANNAVTISGANTLNALAAAQQLATQSVNSAQANAIAAQEALVTLNTQHNIAEAGGTPGDVAAGTVGVGWFAAHRNEILTAVVAALALGGLIYYTKKARR